MEAFSALLALCAGNSPITGGDGNRDVNFFGTISHKEHGGFLDELNIFRARHAKNLIVYHLNINGGRNKFQKSLIFSETIILTYFSSAKKK